MLLWGAPGFVLGNLLDMCDAAAAAAAAATAAAPVPVIPLAPALAVAAAMAAVAAAPVVSPAPAPAVPRRRDTAVALATCAASFARLLPQGALAGECVIWRVSGAERQPIVMHARLRRQLALVQRDAWLLPLCALLLKMNGARLSHGRLRAYDGRGPAAAVPAAADTARRRSDAGGGGGDDAGGGGGRGWGTFFSRVFGGSREDARGAADAAAARGGGGEPPRGALGRLTTTLGRARAPAGLMNVTSVSRSLAATGAASPTAPAAAAPAGAGAAAAASDAADAAADARAFDSEGVSSCCSLLALVLCACSPADGGGGGGRGGSARVDVLNGIAYAPSLDLVRCLWYYVVEVHTTLEAARGGAAAAGSRGGWLGFGGGGGGPASSLDAFIAEEAFGSRWGLRGLSGVLTVVVLACVARRMRVRDRLCGTHSRGWPCGYAFPYARSYEHYLELLDDMDLYERGVPLPLGELPHVVGVLRRIVARASGCGGGGGARCAWTAVVSVHARGRVDERSPPSPALSRVSVHSCMPCGSCDSWHPIRKCICVCVRRLDADAERYAGALSAPPTPHWRVFLAACVSLLRRLCALEAICIPVWGRTLDLCVSPCAGTTGTRRGRSRRRPMATRCG